MNMEFYGKRKRGRPRSRRMDEIGKDLWKMGKRNWKMVAPGRDKLRDLVKEVNGHLDLWRRRVSKYILRYY